MLSKLKWLIVIQLLLNEQALCRIPPPLARRKAQIPGAEGHEGVKEKHNPKSLLGPQHQPGSVDRIQSAKLLLTVFRAKLQGRIHDHLNIKENVTCEELLSASAVGDPSASMFPQELLGLSLVPVLVVAGCPQEAETLVLRLYDLLGVEDTAELLMKVEGLMEKGMRKSASRSESSSTERHIDAVMFNIQQLATMKEDPLRQEDRCEGWTRVNGTTLVGKAVEGGPGDLEEALTTCERLGDLCAGVTHSGDLEPGKYQAVSRKGSRILPSTSSESESWIRQCSMEEEEAPVAAVPRRMKRSTQRRCINKSEERVYNVVEWIPAVSTLYNLGTAVYYASLNCSATAKERAILSAVDLGTDALMVATGGTAGVAGYALGAGVKTGVKAGVRYLLNSMKQEDDVLVNQFSWEEGVITVQ